MTARKGSESLYWSKVDRSGGPDSCWPWMGHRVPDGYGRVQYGGRRTMAHRIAYELCVGPVSRDMCVCHACDNPPCCNPAHLWAGTNQENIADRDAKGRQVALSGDRHWSNRHPQKRLYGERNGLAKLTATDVRSIRTALAEGESTRLIAARYGVTPTAIRDIRSGRTWVHVPAGAEVGNV